MPELSSLLPLLAAAALVAALLAWLGVFAVLRRMAFVADGIAHVSLAGVAVGVLTHNHPLATALLFSLAVGTAVYFLEQNTTLPVDAIITVLFTGSLALGILVMSRSGEELEVLEATLFGDLRTVGGREAVAMVSLALAVGAYLTRIYRQLALLTFDRATAYVAGVNVKRLELTFYLMMVVTIVLGVNVLGVLLVSALMVIPASAAKLVSRTFHGAIAFAIAFAVLIMLAGVPLAYVYDLPPGALVAVAGIILFTFMVGVHRFAMVRR